MNRIIFSFQIFTTQIVEFDMRLWSHTFSFVQCELEASQFAEAKKERNEKNFTFHQIATNRINFL